MNQHNKPYWVYESKDISSLINYLDDYLKQNPNKKATIMLFNFSGKLKDIPELNLLKRYNLKINLKSESLAHLIIKGHYKKEIKEFNNILLYDSKLKLLILINFYPIHINKKFNPLFLQFYDKLSPTYLNAKELEQILNDLSKKFKEIIVKKIIVKDKRGKSIAYRKEDYKISFEEAKIKNETVEKIEFETFDKNSKKLWGYLTRQGIFKCSGTFKMFFDIIFKKISLLELQKIKFYKTHTKKREKKFLPLPLLIDYEEKVFLDTSINKEFINSLKKIKYCSISVYHANPYINLSILDYLDGSSMEIMVDEPSKIMLMPKIGTSHSSLSRIINHIFEYFREGSLKKWVMKKK